MEGDGRERLRKTVYDGGGDSLNMNDVRLQDAVSGGGVGVPGADTRLQGAGSETSNQVKRTTGEAGVAGAAPAPSDGRHEAAHGGPDRLRTGGEEAGAGSAPVVVRVRGDAGPSQSTALIRGAPGKRKRGRPKGSKNKPKTSTIDAQPRKRAHVTSGLGQNPKRSLDSALTRESAANVQGDVGAAAPIDTVNPAEVQTEIAATDAADTSTGATTALDEQGTTTASPGGTRSRPPRQNKLPSILSMYVDTLVAFSPVKEGFISQKKKYVGVGNAFLVGRVCRIVKKSLFQINWLDSQFQNHVETLNLSAVQRGNANYRSIHGNSAGLAWGRLCAVDEGEEVNIDAEMEMFEQFMEPFEPPVEVPTTVAEVEAIKNMRFEPGLQNVPPTDLYQHADGSTKTRLRPEFNHIFQHSSSASLFAYIPVSFWQQVVGEMNTYARIHSIALAKLVSLDELMTFLGILFYMALIDKGEYSNYWGLQVEDTIFSGSSVGLDNVMPLRRFKDLRKVLCFQCVDPRAANTDQAARIRPLLNLLKVTGSKYVEVGRDVALNEASVACRSKFGKPLIVYNPMKPTGKYHFRIYMLCCATTWISLNFRLHCVSDIAERLDGVVSPEDIQSLNEEIEGSSSIRKCVLEVVRPLYCTQRIVNSDNYYTSVQLLIALRIKGLYGRGTVRKTSSHFPKHVLLEKKDCVRGEFRQGVSIDRTMVAASWFDSAIVTVVSNTDVSTQTTVSRQVRAEKREFTAPTCIKAYNTNMQGVDRLDQMRARFSLADGHSFKKWHKKLGLALIDVARANAYLTRRLVVDMTRMRDPHREFLVDLISELLSGKWKEAPSERQMFYADAAGGAVAEQASPSSAVWISGESGERRPFGSPQKQCSAISSKQYYTDMNRKRRGCVVCRWEGRYATQVTDICVLHNVCLCQNVHASSTPYTCPRITWTCWEKYHRWYLPHKLFSLTGEVCTSSRLYKLKQEAMGNPEASGTTAAGRTAVRAIVLGRACGVERSLAGGGGPQLATERYLSTPAFPGYGQVQSTPAFPGYGQVQSTPAFPGYGQVQSTPAFPGYGHEESTPDFPGYGHEESTPAFAGHKETRCNMLKL